jgi:hypothetical protein
VSSRTFPYSKTDLDRFRQVQLLAYDIAQWVESQLQVGMTQAEVRTLVAAGQAQNEVVQVFHEPVVWFGNRTVPDPVPDPDAHPYPDRAPGHTGTPASASNAVRPDASVPAEYCLAQGMPVIIDIAPAVGGIFSDVAYSCVLGRNSSVFGELDQALMHVRTFLLEGVRSGETMAGLYRELDKRIADHGWENCHQRYSDRALGRRVFPLAHEPERTTPIPGFGTAAAEGLLAAELAALDDGTCSPVWRDGPFSDYPAPAGVWAVGPHVGLDGVGVKFEELLVVTEDDAYWLDDHLPHTKRWAAAGFCSESFSTA